MSTKSSRPGDAVIADSLLEDATQAAKVERRTAERQAQAYNEFAETIEGIPGVYTVSHTSGGGPKTIDSQTSGMMNCNKAKDALQELFQTVLQRPPRDEREMLQIMSSELSIEVARAFKGAMDQGIFPPNLKGALIAEAITRKRRYESVCVAITQEVESLSETHCLLSEVRSWLDDQQRDVNQMCFDSLCELRDDAELYVDNLNAAAESRQRLVHSKTGDANFLIQHSELLKRLYTDIPSTYPVLTEIATLAEQVTDLRETANREIPWRS